MSFGALSYLGMVIRFFERTDLAACEQLFDSNTPKFFAEEERVEFTEYLNRLPGPYLVLEEDGEVVACGGWAASRTTPNEIVLCWGMVSKDRHKAGLGTRLMKARLEHIFASNNAAAVLLTTSQHSAGFFERFGFQTVRSEKDGYAPGIDLVEMRLEAGSVAAN
ncbi:GNAT family N-acetyltransferase [Paraburkholderia hospita]|uniref:GNAT family N-acetyltransferase n=1 Tax=Paraburkholderia hospita TaxID=169430 RepID=UPI001FC9F13E|nr:GNAT family N-acetyltransferase [Paraburkholderia hospita]